MSIWPIGCFKGAKVLVVGGTSGIGAAVAQGFLDEGASVIVTGVSNAEIETARQNIVGVSAEVLDVRDDTAIKSLVAAQGKLNHLVNCAGVIRRGDEHNSDVFADVVDINLTGTMRICAAARALLGQTCGTIVNTASMLSFFGGGLVPGYAASKGGIAQLTKSLAIAYAAEGIRVNAVAPGWIETALTKTIRDDPDRNHAILSRTALKRWGSPADLIGGYLYLSSPLASYVTGTILVIDGGYLAV